MRTIPLLCQAYEILVLIASHLSIHLVQLKDTKVGRSSICHQLRHLVGQLMAYREENL